MNQLRLSPGVRKRRGESILASSRVIVLTKDQGNPTFLDRISNISLKRKKAKKRNSTQSRASLLMLKRQRRSKERGCLGSVSTLRTSAGRSKVFTATLRIWINSSFEHHNPSMESEEAIALAVKWDGFSHDSSFTLSGEKEVLGGGIFVKDVHCHLLNIYDESTL